MTPLLLSMWPNSFASILTKGFSWLYNLIATLITYLFNFLFAIVLQVVVRLCAGFLYNLLHILLAFVDLFEDVFNIFAGTRQITYNNEKMYFIDLFFVDGNVQRALVYITFIGVALCFIFTIYSVVKSMGSYILESKRPVSEVLKTALKSCIAFLMVPIMGYFGIQLSTVILKSTEMAIMQSTGTDEQPRIASILFLAGTFNDDDPDASYTDELRAPYFYGDKKINDTDTLNEFTMMPSLDVDGLLNLFNGMTKGVPGDAKDEAVASGGKVSKDSLEKDSTYNEQYTISDQISDEYYGSHNDIIDALFKDLYNYPLVYLLSIGVIIIMLCSMFVFIRKIVELVILYVTSPIFVSTMPLDGGLIFKRWRDMFIGKLFSGFGIVISMKLVMIFIPLIMSSTVRFSNVTAVDLTIKMIFIIGCLFAAWKSNTTVLEVINPEIAAADRASAAAMAGYIKMAAKQAVNAGMAVATGGTSAAAGAAAKGASSAAAGGAKAGAGEMSAKAGIGEKSGKMNVGGMGGKGGSDAKGGEKSGSEAKGGEKSGSEAKGGGQSGSEAKGGEKSGSEAKGGEKSGSEAKGGEKSGSEAKSDKGNSADKGSDIGSNDNGSYDSMKKQSGSSAQDKTDTIKEIGENVGSDDEENEEQKN